MHRSSLLLMCALFMLTGCGDTRLERAGSGAVIGGVAGLAVGTICCGDPFDGAQLGGLIGAAGGAAIGAISPRPLFFNHEGEYWPYDGNPETPAASMDAYEAGAATPAASSRPARPATSTSTYAPARAYSTAPTYAPAPAYRAAPTYAPAPPGRDYQ